MAPENDRLLDGRDDRRHFLQSMMVSALFVVSLPFRVWAPTRRADTAAPLQYVEAFALAVSAFSLFSKSDNGLSDFLSGLRRLSEENIRLMQAVVEQLESLQRQVDRLPEQMRLALREDAAWRIRERTQSMVQTLEVVRRAVARGSQVSETPYLQAQLLHLLTTGAELAGSAASPSGVGPVGAFCAPIVLACVARAHELLGQPEMIRDEAAARYLPWMEATVAASRDGSLPQLINQQAGEYKGISEKALNRLGPRIGPLLKKDLSRILQVEPGASVESHLISLYYEYHFRSDLKCIQWRRSSGKYGEGEGCAKYKRNPVYRAGAASDLWYQVRSVAPERGSPEVVLDFIWGSPVARELSPADELKWRRALSDSEDARRAPKPSGQKGKEKDKKAQQALIPDSPVGKQLREELESARTTLIAPMNEHRRVVWGYSTLMTEVMDASKRAKGIFRL